MFVLKIIAVTTMFIDHSAVAFSGFLPPDVYIIMRSIGRIAFPIFVFCIAEGCRRTSNITRFLFRLLIFAVVSEFAFDMLSAASWGFTPAMFLSSYVTVENWGLSWSFNGQFLQHQNVIFTLFLSVLAIHLYKSWHKDGNNVNNIIAGFLSVIFMGTVASVINSDYGFIGVLIIFLSYFCDKRLSRIVPIVLLAFLLYNQIFLLVGAVAAVIPIYLYNGERGTSFKWGFYAFYPLHLFALGIIGMLLG